MSEDGSQNEELNQLNIENGESEIEKAAVRTFRVYENKKLIIGHMPDYYFIQPQITEEDDEVPSTSRPGKKKDEIDCNEYCINQCYYTAGDPICIAECLASCGR